MLQKQQKEVGDETISGVWVCFREAFELLVNSVGPFLQLEKLGILGIFCYSSSYLIQSQGLVFLKP